MEWLFRAACFLCGVIAMKVIDMMAERYRSTRQERRAINAAEEAKKLAEQLALKRGISPDDCLREARQIITRKTGIDWGAMNPGATPDPLQQPPVVVNDHML
jgi:hypothetical protein